MVEAMVERTPEYPCQFAKQYRYFICRSEPIFDHTVTKNFAYCLQMNDDFCKATGSHYHVIASNDQLPDSFKSTASKLFIIHCLVTCFKPLIKSNLKNIVFHGEIMNKIDEAVSSANNTNCTLQTLRENYLTLIVFFLIVIKLKLTFCLIVRLIDSIVFIMVVFW